MDNLVQRLRDQEKSFSEDWLVMLEAADRIEALEAALQEIACQQYSSTSKSPCCIARRALEGK